MSVHSSDSGVSPSTFNMSLTEWDLLDEQATSGDTSFDCSSGPTQHESRNAPLVMHSALAALASDAFDSQYGLFGQVISTW